MRVSRKGLQKRLSAPLPFADALTLSAAQTKHIVETMHIVALLDDRDGRKEEAQDARLAAHVLREGGRLEGTAW